MKYLVTAQEMKTYDRNTMERIGIPGAVLMERAALETFYALRDRGKVSRGNHVLIMAGYGNNGGDGLVLARLLFQAGLSVEVYLVGDRKKATEQWSQEKEILGHYPITYVNRPSRQAYDILVDALLGVGLSRPLEGEMLQAVELFNRLCGYKVACDIPSGISSDTGKILGMATKCDLTVTYGFEKRGLYFYPGREYAGECVQADVGISQEAFIDQKPEMFYLEESFDQLLPKRKPEGNKGTFGKALIIAGSFQMAGAALLSASACYRSGAGMVKILSPRENRVILQESIPEALLGNYEDLEESLKWCQVICIGPGIGVSIEAARVLERVLQEKKPLLIDADGINLICNNMVLIQYLHKAAKEGREIVLTPHMGELLRLWNACYPTAVQTMDELKEGIIDTGKILSKDLGVVLVAKDAVSLIFEPGGSICMNVAGNNGMATAGSGDVLAGILTAFMAQGLSVFEAATRGTRIHGLAGDSCTQKYGEHWLMAGDLIREL